jgi:hypothetical protein
LAGAAKALLGLSIKNARTARYYQPRNHEICVQFEQIKQLALLFAQSKLKKVATAVFSWALLVQKRVLLQMGHLNCRPLISIGWGSSGCWVLNKFICWEFKFYILDKIDMVSDP